MAKEMESDDHVIEEVAEMPDSADEGEEGTGEDKQEAEDRKQDQLQKPQEMQHFQEDDREHGTAAEAEELQMNALGDDGTALASSAPQTQEEDDAEETEGIVTSAVTDSQPTNAPSELNSSVPADHVDDAAIDPFEALLQEVHALIAAGPSSATGSNDDPVPPQLPEEALSIPQAQAPQQTLAQKAGQQQHAQRLEPDQKQDTQLQPEQQAQHEVIHPVLVRGYVESQAHQATNSDVAVEAQPQQSEKPSIHTPVAPLNASQEPSSVLKPTPLFDQAQSVVSAPSCSSSTGPVHVAPPTAAVATVPAPAPAPTPVLTSVTLPATATAPARPVAPKPSHGTRSSALPRRRQVSHLPLPVGTKTLPHQPTSPSRASALSSSSREAASSRTHLTQITPAMSQAGHVSVQQQQLLQNKIYPPSFTQMSVKELSRLTALHTRSNEVQMVRIKLDTVRLRGRRRPPSPTSRIRRLGQDDGFGEDQDWEEDDDAEDDGDGDADLVTEPEHPIASPLPATIHRNTSTRVLRSSSSTSPRTISGSKQQQLRVGEGSSRKRVRWEDDGVRRGAGASGAPMKSNKKPRRWAPPRYRMGGLTSATRSNVEATLSNGSALMPRTPTGKGPGVILCGKSCLTPKLRTLQLDALGNSMDTERPLDLHAQLKKTKVVVKRYIYDGEDEDELGGERIEEEDAHRLSAGAPMVGAGGPVARAGRGAVAIAGAISLGFHSGPGEGGLLLIPALGGSRSRGGPPHTAAVAAGRYR
ncbi:hypothetical protein OC861_005796 [Tilletia horrida]|nr:hypothetical protein OC861_005796 [Tilletia horrida]